MTAWLRPLLCSHSRSSGHEKVSYLSENLPSGVQVWVLHMRGLTLGCIHTAAQKQAQMSFPAAPYIVLWADLRAKHLQKYTSWAIVFTFSSISINNNPTSQEMDSKLDIWRINMIVRLIMGLHTLKYDYLIMALLNIEILTPTPQPFPLFSFFFFFYNTMAEHVKCPDSR